MKNLGKWIGAGLGWTIGGPIGAVVGFALGTLADSSNFSRLERPDHSTTTGDFVISMLVLIAGVMKADQRLLHSELDFVKRYLVKSFGEEEAGEMLRILRDILKQDIPVKDVTRQIRGSMDYPSRLQLVHLIFGIAVADDAATEQELNLIAQIAADLGLSVQDTASVRNMYVPSTDWAYRILGVDPSADNETIKKAYRSLAMKNHPDKITYLGEEIRLKAQEKFQKINEAYLAVKKERGMS